MKDGLGGLLAFIVYCACVGHDEIHEVVFCHFYI
jgi:hypothetical protein